MEGASQTPEAERCQSLSLPSTDKMTRPPSVWLQLGHVVMAYLLSRVGASAGQELRPNRLITSTGRVTGVKTAKEAPGPTMCTSWVGEYCCCSSFENEDEHEIIQRLFMSWQKAENTENTNLGTKRAILIRTIMRVYRVYQFLDPMGTRTVISLYVSGTLFWRSGSILLVSCYVLPCTKV